MKVIETEIEGVKGVGTDVGWLVRGGIAAVEDDMRQTYTVKHIRKGLTLLSSEIVSPATNVVSAMRAENG